MKNFGVDGFRRIFWFFDVFLVLRRISTDFDGGSRTSANEKCQIPLDIGKLTSEETYFFRKRNTEARCIFSLDTAMYMAP